MVDVADVLCAYVCCSRQRAKVGTSPRERIQDEEVADRRVRFGGIAGGLCRGT